MSMNVAENIFCDDKPASWIENVSKYFLKKKSNKNLIKTTKVHPCIINNKRVLVHEYGLNKQNPEALKKLKAYAKSNNFEIKEDQRIKDDVSVKFERRTARSLPMLFLASGIFMSGTGLAASIDASDKNIKVLPDIEVTATQDNYEQSNKHENNKQFITNPYGETESILVIAEQTKTDGMLERVSTKEINMPANYVGGFINKYKKTFSNGQTFSYYEGEGFGALGYHVGDNKIVLDVLVGGENASPKLWGPYDQLLSDKDNSTMELMMSDDNTKDIGLLKASYAIGFANELTEEDYFSIDNLYAAAINETVKVLIENDHASTKNIASTNKTNNGKG